MKRAPAGRTIYDREGPAGWAVVVMPDGVLVDSYHGPPHVHTNPGVPARDRKLPIRFATKQEVLRIVRQHLDANLTPTRAAPRGRTAAPRAVPRR